MIKRLALVTALVVLGSLSVALPASAHLLTEERAEKAINGRGKAELASVGIPIEDAEFGECRRSSAHRYSCVIVFDATQDGAPVVCRFVVTAALNSYNYRVRTAITGRSCK